MNLEQTRGGALKPADIMQTSIETRVSDLVRLGIIALFAYWSFRLVAPFALIVIWSAILAIAMFPLHAMLARVLGNRPIISSTIIVIACLLLVIAPLSLVAVNFADAAQDLITRLRTDSFALPTAPQGIREWPVVGERVYGAWNQIASNLAASITKFQAPLREIAGVVVTKLASIGAGLLGFIVSVVLSGFLMATGERLSSIVAALANRVAGDRGVGFAKLAATTVRNVSRGVIGVAFLQTLLCGLCFVIFGLPARGALTFAVFILCVMQIGPGLVLIPAVIWAWFSWPVSTSLAFTLIATPITLLDNVLKPLLMARGLTTPMPVILIGVIGGTLSYGLLGLFLGPIVLSVFYELLRTWAWPAPQSDSPTGGVEGDDIVDRSDTC
ncbi:membrane protein [Rhizobium leguminosarum bv. trifolii CB782]|nr:membrane protein [Rhizobium leguminosarum bv. trifolii CB782]